MGVVTINHEEQDDATSPLPTIIEGSRTGSALRRPIAPAQFWIVTLVLIGALGATVYVLSKSIAKQQPTGIITPAQQHEAASKKRELENLRALAAAGRFEDAIRGYDAYLGRYPHSIVAQNERAEAQRMHEETRAAIEPDVEVERVARKPRREKVAEKVDEPPKKKLSRWERIKRWARGE